MTGRDNIGKRYYPDVQRLERMGNFLFYVGALLSIIILLIDKQATVLLILAQTVFIIDVTAFFICNTFTTLVSSTTAHDKRVQGFLSKCFQVRLLPERSDDYFGNDEEKATRAILASLLENTLYTKRILRRMLRSERVKFTAYGLSWFLALVFRSNNLELASIIAQVVLTEQIFLRLIKMEWLCQRVNGVFDDTYQLLLSPSNKAYVDQARSIEYLVRYETSKTQAGISLSSSVFNDLHPQLRKEWEEIIQALKIKTG